MNERIMRLAQAALKYNSCLPSIPERCEDENELKDPIAIAEGYKRFLLKLPLEVRDDDLLADRYRWWVCG